MAPQRPHLSRRANHPHARTSRPVSVVSVHGLANSLLSTRKARPRGSTVRTLRVRTTTVEGLRRPSTTAGARIERPEHQGAVRASTDGGYQHCSPSHRPWAQKGIRTSEARRIPVQAPSNWNPVQGSDCRAPGTAGSSCWAHDDGSSGLTRSRSSPGSREPCTARGSVLLSGSRRAGRLTV